MIFISRFVIPWLVHFKLTEEKENVLKRNFPLICHQIKIRYSPGFEFESFFADFTTFIVTGTAYYCFLLKFILKFAKNAKITTLIISTL
jgi:hypothetical protein